MSEEIELNEDDVAVDEATAAQPVEASAEADLDADAPEADAPKAKSSAKKVVKQHEPLFPDTVLLRHILEGAILAAGKPLSIDQMRELFEEHERPTADEILVVLEEIRAHHQKRGFELREIGSGWRFQVVQDVAQWVSRLWEEKPQRYSRAVLETLALIAYRQPITRGDIEEIRGVQVASNIIKTLQERDWVRVVGHKDVPGRPALFATTRKFLDYFNLKSLDELPSLAELRDLESLNHEMVFETPPVPASLPMPDDEDAATEEPIYAQTEVHEGEMQPVEAQQESSADDSKESLSLNEPNTVSADEHDDIDDESAGFSAQSGQHASVEEDATAETETLMAAPPEDGWRH
jgi:segregation and condensation protein B